MLAFCARCGKKDYLNSDGVCYHCYQNPDAPKFRMRKGIKNVKGNAALYWTMLVLNFFCSSVMLYFIGNVIKDGLGIPWIVCYFFIVLYVGSIRLKYAQYPVWQEPLVNIFAKLLCIGIQNNYILLIWNVFLIIGLLVQRTVNDKREDRQRYYLYDVCYKEKDEGLEVIKQFREFNKEIRFNYCEQWEDELPIVQQVMENLCIEEKMKQKLMKLFRDESGKIYMNNETKYYYCQVLQELLSRIGIWDFNGKWMEPIHPALQQFACQYPGYDTKITQRNYMLASRLRTEVIEPYQILLDYQKRVGYDLGQFRGDCIAIFLGEGGERRVADTLRGYSDQIILLPNIRLEVEGESIENDFILLSPYGIYVLEVKNLGSGGGYSLRIEKDGRWSKVYGQRTEIMSNVVAQNERHILYLEKHINQKLERPLDDYIRVQGMVVLANDVVDIFNESDDLVVRYTNIMSTIRNRPIIMKEAEIKEIAGILQESSLPPKKYPVINGFHEVYMKGKAWLMEYNEWRSVTKPLSDAAEQYLE